MPKSVLEAIKMGLWDFEPSHVDQSEFESTEAMPGTRAKLEVLARRVENGLPLWHPGDRDEVPEQLASIDPPSRPNKPR